jgi:uncharacterized lipoprotein YmbA
MSAKPCWALILVGASLAACQSSPPTHYFALTETAANPDTRRASHDPGRA